MHSLKMPHSHILSLFLFLLVSIASSSVGGDLTSDLHRLRTQSSTSVIHLTDDLLGRILALPRPRPFSFLVFFDAKQLHTKHELQLPTLKSDFSIIASSFLHNNPNADTLFFFDVEFKDSERSFNLFAVNSLPHVRIVAPHVNNIKDSSQMTQSEMSRLAEALPNFIESNTGVSVGPIHRPPMFSGKVTAFIMAGLIIWSPLALKRVISGKTILHDCKIWLSGAIFVYFFSVSGTMYTIIRQMPMFLADRKDPSKLIFFQSGHGMQLGAEGFAVGFLYTVVGVLLGFMTHGVVKVRDLKVQRIMCVSALIVCFWAVKKVVYLDNWKTGYGIHAYWPSTWK